MIIIITKQLFIHRIYSGNIFERALCLYIMYSDRIWFGHSTRDKSIPAFFMLPFLSNIVLHIFWPKSVYAARVFSKLQLQTTQNFQRNTLYNRSGRGKKLSIFRRKSEQEQFPVGQQREQVPIAHFLCLRLPKEGVPPRIDLFTAVGINQRGGPLTSHFWLFSTEMVAWPPFAKVGN